MRVLSVGTIGMVNVAVSLGIPGGCGMPGWGVGIVSKLYGLGLRTGDDAVHPSGVGRL